jgi:hypothetical protein
MYYDIYGITRELNVVLSIYDELTHSWNWVLLEKLPIVQLLKNFPAFNGTRRFITVFTRVLQRSLSRARSIQSIPSHPVPLRFIWIFSTHLRLGLPSGLLPSGFPINILYAFIYDEHRMKFRKRKQSIIQEVRKEKFLFLCGWSPCVYRNFIKFFCRSPPD